MRKNDNRMKIFLMGALAIAFLMVVPSVLLGLGPILVHEEGPVQSLPTRAAMGQASTFPASNNQLLANTTYNFTAALRDDAYFNRNYENGYITINKEGNDYSNVSLTRQGTFNATYSFTNDQVGGLAEGFTYMVGTGASVQVVESYLGHHKCLQVISGTTETRATNDFPAQASGTITLWYLVTSPLNYNIVMMLASSTRIAIDGGTWHYYNGAWTDLGVSASANRWYYVNLTWSGSSFKLCVDGETLATFTQVVTVNSYATATGTMGGAYSYVDALDYSWSPGYISYRSAVDLSQFGIYEASDSFENETTFAVPTGFTNGSGAGTRSYVVPQVPSGLTSTGHRNVLILDDQSGSQRALVNCSIPTFSAGSIEFWVYSSDVSKEAYLPVFLNTNTGDYATFIIIQDSKLCSFSASAVQVIQAITSNTWYHVRVALDCVNHKYNVWVNGILKQTAMAFQMNADSIDKLQFNTGAVVGTGFYVTLDALDISTDPLYYIERSAYMHLQQEKTFSEVGSYSFRFTLTSSGTDHAGSWTPFSVVVPEVPPVPEYTVLFSASSGDLLGVPVDAAFLSIDGVSQAWGPVELLNGTHNVTVRDYFGDVLFSQNVTFVAGGSYSIPLTLATLVINNYQSEPISVEITKTGCSGTFRQLVGAQVSIVIRLASATYRVRAYNLRRDLVGEHASVILAPGANQQADFGTPEGPFTLEWMILVGILALCAVLLVVANARIGGKGGRDEYLSLERPTKEDKRAKMAAYVAPEAPPKAVSPETRVPAPATLAAKAPAPATPVVTPLPLVKPKPEVKPASAAEKLSPIDPRREFIKQIDKDIDFLYAFVRTLDAQFGQGQITNDLYLQQKNAAAEKIGELMGKKEQFLSEKPKA